MRMANNTGNPIGSIDLRDLQDNARNLDFLINGDADFYYDRFNVKRVSLSGLTKKVDGLTNDIKDISGVLNVTAEWKEIPGNTSVELGGDEGALNAQAFALGARTELLRKQTRELLKRSYAEVGLNLVDGSFEEGASLATNKDVLLQENTGLVFGLVPNAYPKIVDENSLPDQDWILLNISLFTILTSEDGASKLGTKKGINVENIISKLTTLADAGINDSVSDSNLKLSQLAQNLLIKAPIFGNLVEISSSGLDNINHLVSTIVKHGDVKRVPGIYPEILGGKYSVSYHGGSQLSQLNDALSNPKFQNFGITFIGDSITWGTGSTGQETTGPERNGTLGDYRNNSRSCSYVNEFRRWVKDLLGPNVVEEISNHQQSPSGESISIFKKSEYCFPKGSDYTFAKTGIATDVITENLVGPYLKARRNITVNSGGSATLTFVMTGSEFTLVFGGLSNGAKYQLLINGKLIGTFSSRVGDDGILNQNNQRRRHTFDYIKNGNVSINVIQYNGEVGNNALYIEALLFERSITVSNQGIIGATTGSYLTYNFPVSVSSGIIKRLSTLPNWLETTTGPGATSLNVSNPPESSTGEQRRYGYLSNSFWELNFNIPSGNDKIIIGYSSLANTGAAEIYANNVLIETIHTSDLYPGNTTGYGKNVEVTIPLTTTDIKIKMIYEVLGGGNTCYFYLEGIGYRNSSTVIYPDNNGFNKGVSLKSKDMFVFFQLGVNDRSNGKVASSDEVHANIEKMLGLLPQATKPILMVSPNAINTETHNFNMYRVKNEILKLARKNQIDFIDNFNLFGNCPLKYFTTDNLHPNDVGHALIAKNIINAITNGS